MINRWSTEKANAWYARQPWLVGCNFIPSSAVNQLEMWQAKTFDPGTIDRELGWAAGIGFNAIRTYLHDLAWGADADRFKPRDVMNFPPAIKVVPGTYSRMASRPGRSKRNWSSRPPCASSSSL